MAKYFVTTPIYYVNDVPHLGHAYTTLVADILARWHRQRGDNVFFLTGTDEHGAKVQQAAEAQGLSPKEFADKTSQTFKDAWGELNLSPDYFIRTSDSKHEQVVQSLLQKIYDAGYIYQAVYEGLYCIGCEKFLQPDDLVDGKCPLHPNQQPVQQKETNYFFKLSAFRDKLLQALEDGTYKIVPAGRRKEIVGKLKQGLEDISISRAEVTWGVPIPWDKTQTIYVWVDALINYYSATQFIDGKKEFWPAQVHLLGKDILWFHAVIWEALLMAAELPLPKVVAAHGFFTINGQKISKSLGNVIAPSDMIKEFGVDATRYLIIADIPFAGDSDVSWERFKGRYQSDLANGLGNTFSRITNMAEKFCAGIIEKGIVTIEFGDLSRFDFDLALSSTMSALRTIDREIDDSKPWDLIKTDEPKVVKLVTQWVKQLRGIAQALEPFMPETAKTIQTALTAATITKAAPLFPRLDKS